MKKSVFLFPGQGSQKPGMLGPFLASHLLKKYFQNASQVVGYDLLELAQTGTAEDLKLTAKAQPLILTTSYLAFKIFQEANPTLEPTFLAGHSLGEYTAFLAAEVLSFKDAVHLVHNRGMLMQACCPPGVGGMAAILGKDEQALTQLCKECAEGEILSPANFNCPGQIVVAGHKTAIARLLKKTKGVALEVSVPFHCPLLQPMIPQMQKVIDQTEFKTARWPVVANVDNADLTEPLAIKKNLIAQITAPVQWQKGIEKMLGAGVQRFFEFGSGKVLTNLNKRITESITNVSLESLELAQSVYEL